MSTWPILSGGILFGDPGPSTGKSFGPALPIGCRRSPKIMMKMKMTKTSPKSPMNMIPMIPIPKVKIMKMMI